MAFETAVTRDYYANLASERLLFRPMKLQDFSEWVVFFDQNEREKYLALDENLNKEEKAQNWIELQLERYANNELGHLAILSKSSGDLIGVAGLLYRNKDKGFDLEVAYSILPKYWGNGYATEAAQTMKSFAKEKKLHRRLVSWIHPENKFSQNVAKKNGMRWEGETIMFRGIEVQVWVCAIT